MKFNCVTKTAPKLNWMFSGTAQFSHQVFSFFVSSVCLLVRVTMVDKNKAVVCCLLATSAIMLSGGKKKRKRKMWSKKWYLKRGVYHAMFICGMIWVPGDDAIVVSAGKLRKLWDFLSELRNSLCERRLEMKSSEACAIACQNCAVYSLFFRHVWRHTVKSPSLTGSV